MSRSKSKKLDIDIEVDVLTKKTLSEISNCILELLLYQRNQIEVVYKTFKVFVNKWKENNENTEDSNASLHYYLLGRQREKAIQTKDSISAMQELIDNAFEQHMVKSIRFLFGSTMYTPKESYTIHMPTKDISTNHLHNHHRMPNMHLNQLLISLLTREELYGIFSNNLCPTNLYLELETLEQFSESMTSNISCLLPKQLGRLPGSCKDIHFHLRHKLPLGIDETILNCCKDLEIFSDLLHGDHRNQSVQEESISLNELLSSNWWEADIIVRGFKEKLVKGQSIWKK